MKKFITTLSILLIATASYAQTYTVERVIDGDTIVVTTPEGKSEKVRLIGIDAPESKPNDKAKRDSARTGQDIETITKMGQEATDYIKGLIGYSLPVEVRLDFDVQRKDKYGRLLAYVYSGCYCQWNNDESPCSMEEVPDHEYVILKGSKKDNVWCNFVNATMIKAGYATLLTTPPNVKYADLFHELFREAADNNRGLWGKGWNFSLTEEKLEDLIKKFDDVQRNLEELPNKINQAQRNLDESQARTNLLFEEYFKMADEHKKLACSTDNYCVCLSGSGVTFMGCSNAKFGKTSFAGSYKCDVCQCVDNLCKQTKDYDDGTYKVPIGD